MVVKRFNKVSSYCRRYWSRCSYVRYKKRKTRTLILSLVKIKFLNLKKIIFKNLTKVFELLWRLVRHDILFLWERISFLAKSNDENLIQVPFTVI